MSPVNLVNLIFTLTVNRTVNRARAREKAELWSICSDCFQHGKARIIGNQKRCPFCNTPTSPLIEFFGEDRAINEATEELQYRNQLRNDRAERRKMHLESSSTPPILESEGYDKGVSRGGVIA